MAKNSLIEKAREVFKKANELNEDATAGIAVKTQHPNSGPSDPPQTLAGPATMIHAPEVPGEGENAGAIQASVIPGKTKTEVNANAADIPLGQVHHNDEIDPDLKNNTPEDNFGISEELTAFIQKKIEEGLTDDQISAAIAEEFETSGVDLDIPVPDLSEHMEALFSGETLSEDFKNKARTIFEAAVKSGIEAGMDRIEEVYAETLAEEVQALEETYVEKIDDFLGIVTEEWTKENEIALESNLRTEWADEFIGGLKTLFEQHFVDIPEEKVSVVEAIGSELAETTDKLNVALSEAVELRKTLAEQGKIIALNEATIGLTVVQAAKLKELAESINYDPDTFSDKVKVLKESYITKLNATDTSNVLDLSESVYSKDGKNVNGQVVSEAVDPFVANAAKLLAKTAKH